jgi:hypothetical protein
MWLGADLRTDTKKESMCLQEIGLCAEYFIEQSRVEWSRSLRGPIWSLKKKDKLDKETDIQMSSENYEENGYSLKLYSLIISYWLHVWYPKRSGCEVSFLAHLP